MESNPRFEQLISEGLAASQQGRAEAALTSFNEAAALVPVSGIPHFLIGSEHAAAGNLEAAEAAFANAVLLAPAFALARYQLGLLQFSSGRAAVALITWQPLSQLPETDALPHFVRGFAELAQDRFGEALDHYRAGLQCAGANPAVCEDIRKLVNEVERLQAGTAVPAADGAAGHFLLTGYGKGLH
ncbi:tetratricopeptide repeat protein [Ramlibacter humi]|uniref:Uncharacterized protein n=1 Tax=Ramlibacter humi TaxID=2530451 RepID=A0A4Z0BE34_9BURK|nr:tetratricopeptide repeat protein [Ramlibacter humi]TFY97070.1 hypothetical protein EZ216_19610 [Ramlibacter humi]